MSEPRVLLGMADGELNLCDAVSLRVLSVSHHHRRNRAVLCIAISPDGRLVATGDRGACILIHRMSDMEAVGTIAEHTDDVNGLAWTRDGRHLLSASDDHTLRIWEMGSQTCVARHDFGGTCFSVDVARSGRCAIASIADALVRLECGGSWTLQQQTEVANIPGSCCIHPVTEHLVAVGSGDQAFAKLVDIERGAVVLEYAAPYGSAGRPSTTSVVNSVSFSSSGALLLIVSEFGRGALYRAASGEIVHTFDRGGASFWRGCFSPTEQMILVANGTDLEIYETASGALVRTHVLESDVWSLCPQPLCPWTLLGPLRQLCVSRLSGPDSAVAVTGLPRHVAHEIDEQRRQLRTGGAGGLVE